LSTPDDTWTKLGLMVPSSNTSVEIDFRRAARPGVSVHTARMWLTGSDADVLDRMNEDMETAARHLGSAAVELVVYACTGGSLYGGVGYDTETARRLTELTGGIPAVTTTTAALEALRALEIKRLTLLTPYPARMTGIVRDFLEANGFEVRSVAGRSHGDNLEIGEDPPEAIAAFAREHLAEDVDGIFCSCTNWRAMAAAEAIEAATGKPVVTSNQATIWAAYRRLGIAEPIEGYGRLLRGP
jgi:maleate cis-trans isomerase